jgi:prepilin-type processing-associated H-X9-DG protein/prepilin-type N-terminal cleavage/methylation domain-containing protein
VKSSRAFTLLELLAAMGVIAVLAVLTLAAAGKLRSTLQGAHCTNNLRQLGAATALYLNDNERRYFDYSRNVPEGRLWYFGLEKKGGGSREGDRDLDRTKSPLYPYLQSVGGVEVCLAFPYEQAIWKPKFKGGSWGYGYNTSLSGVNMAALERPSRVIVFGDCAQVNTFQPPASPSKPMVEEFYMIESRFKTIHFRHGASANLLFADGHVQAMQVFPGTEDDRLPEANVGRVTAVGSVDLLR